MGNDTPSNQPTFGSIFGKAKKWAQQELKNTVAIGDGSSKGRLAEEAQDDLARDIESDAELVKQNMIIDALTPQSLKDYQAQSETSRQTRQAEAQGRARLDRAERAGESRVELSGYVTGSADGLAVDVTESEEGTDIYVLVECIDAVMMEGGTITGFCFAIPGYHGDGVYTLVDTPEFDSLQYELYFEGESEGWGFHPTYGPGVITVQDGVADVRLVLGSVGTETIDLHATVVLATPAPR